MFRKIITLLKAIVFTVVAGGVLIASFYAAYAILAIIVLFVIGAIAYSIFSWDRFVKWVNSDD